VWEITASGNYKDLHDFGGTVTNAAGTAGPDGFGPWASVVFNKAGNMVGTAGQGGPNYIAPPPPNPFPQNPVDFGGVLWTLVPPTSPPTAPALTASASTGGVRPITLTWDAVTGALVYRVYRSTVSGAEANPRQSPAPWLGRRVSA
jgi:hypothetical protein